MKKTLFTLAMLIMGGFSLSTVTQANAAPIAAVANAGEAVKFTDGVEKVTFKRKYYPKGYYKGFCRDYRNHGWCKRYYWPKYYGYRGHRKHFHRGRFYKKRFFRKHFRRYH